MGCHPNPIDELIFFKMGFNHQPYIYIYTYVCVSKIPWMTVAPNQYEFAFWICPKNRAPLKSLAHWNGSKGMSERPLGSTLIYLLGCASFWRVILLFYVSRFFLDFCFPASLLFCFSLLLDFSASLLVCFSKISAFLLLCFLRFSLLLCFFALPRFFAFLLLCISAFLLSLFLCFSSLSNP